MNRTQTYSPPAPAPRKPVPAKLYQENHYYPFGMNMKGLESQDVQTVQNKDEHLWQYNGKERQDDFNLFWADYGARNYDSQLGRWHSVDEFSELHYEVTPYHYTANNPISRIDTDGNDYELVVNHKTHEITIRATYYATSKNLDRANQATDVWNNFEGLSYVTFDEEMNEIEYSINFELEVKEVESNEKAKEAAKNDEKGNAFFVTNDATVEHYSKHGENALGVTRGSQYIFVRNSTTDKEKQKKVDGHEIGHTLTSSFSEKGYHAPEKGYLLYKAASGIELNVSNSTVTNVLLGAGIGMQGAKYTKRPKVKLSEKHPEFKPANFNDFGSTHKKNKQ